MQTSNLSFIARFPSMACFAVSFEELPLMKEMAKSSRNHSGQVDQERLHHPGSITFGSVQVLPGSDTHRSHHRRFSEREPFSHTYTKFFVNNLSWVQTNCCHSGLPFLESARYFLAEHSTMFYNLHYHCFYVMCLRIPHVYKLVYLLRRTTNTVLICSC
jgi:hypothetical protein